MVWGWTPRPQHPRWLCPLAQGGLPASHPWLQPGHGVKSWQNPQTIPPAEVHSLQKGSQLCPRAPHVTATCIPAAAWPPHRAPTPPGLQLGPSPLLSASASWSEIPALPPQLCPSEARPSPCRETMPSMYSSIWESSSCPGESTWLALSNKWVIKTEQPAFNLWVKWVIKKKKRKLVLKSFRQRLFPL